MDSTTSVQEALKAIPTMIVADSSYFCVSKTWSQERGPSVCFRNWRASHHCAHLHGYALGVTIDIASYDLDKCGWVIDFAGMKDLKAQIDDMFDHKTIVEYDDPALKTFQQLDTDGVIDLVTIERVSCEGFASEIYQMADAWLTRTLRAADDQRTPLPWVERIVVTEHTGNSAEYRYES